MPDTHNTQSLPTEPKKGRKPRTDFALYMDNLSDVPQPPSQETMDSYNEWLRTKGHKPTKPLDTLRKYTWKSGEKIRKDYLLSPDAHDGLFKLAVRHHYARDVGTGRNRKISALIRAFGNPDLEWYDNRPEELKNIDQRCFELGLTPWWLGRGDIIPRKHTEVYITQQTEDTLYRLAFQRMVFNRAKLNMDNTNAIVGFLLEVIGRNRLVPTNLPDNPNPPKYKYQPPTPNYSINYAVYGGYGNDAIKH
jgi:hypothetical protein